MATIWPLLLLFSVISTAEAQEPKQSLFRPGSPGSLLTPNGTNSSWLSRSGLYAFGFYKLQGNGYAVGIFIAGIPQKTVVWTANRDNPPLLGDVKLSFTSDGRLVLLTAQGMETGNAVNTTEGAAAASMLDSGNFVLYNSDNRIIWQSFDQPTDTLLPGQKLKADKTDGKVLFSSRSDTDHSKGIFRLIMQQDGWLAMYPVGTNFSVKYGYWNDGGVLGGRTDVSLNFDTDGRLYLLNGTGISIVNITKGGPTKDVIYRLRIDPDGTLRHYSHNMDQNGDWKITWFGPNDTCAPKDATGLCQECLPGFKRVNQDRCVSGCERNSDSKSCESKGSVSGCERNSDSKSWESKGNNRVKILIILVSLLSFGCIILAISGIAIYKYRRWLYRSISNAR